MRPRVPADWPCLPKTIDLWLMAVAAGGFWWLSSGHSRRCASAGSWRRTSARRRVDVGGDRARPRRARPAPAPGSTIMLWPQVRRPVVCAFAPARSRRPGFRDRRRARSSSSQCACPVVGEGRRHGDHVGAERGGTARESAGRSTRSGPGAALRGGRSSETWLLPASGRCDFVVALAAAVEAEQDLVVPPRGARRGTRSRRCVTRGVACRCASGVPPTTHKAHARPGPIEST